MFSSKSLAVEKNSPELVSSEPNLINDRGVYSGLVNSCHHQIIFAKINFNAPSYTRKI